MKSSDREVQDAFAHYMLLGTVGEAIERVKCGEQLSEDTILVLQSEGIEVEAIEEEFSNG